MVSAKNMMATKWIRNKTITTVMTTTRINMMLITMVKKIATMPMMMIRVRMIMRW